MRSRNVKQTSDEPSFCGASRPAEPHLDAAPGVRPCPGAAGSGLPDVQKQFDAYLLAGVAAPGDGRTPSSPQSVVAVSRSAHPAGQPTVPPLVFDFRFSIFDFQLKRLQAIFGVLVLALTSLSSRAADDWPAALARMPLAGHVAQLSRTNCVEVMLNAFQSNSVVKALIFMPGATDEFYMFRRARAELTNAHPSLLDAVCALTNQTLIRVTAIPSLLLLHTDEDPLEPLVRIEHAPTVVKVMRARFPSHMLCNDRDWTYVQPTLKKALKMDIRPWRSSYDTWHFYRHSFAGWNMTGWEALETVALAGKTTVTVIRNRIVFEGDDRVRAAPRVQRMTNDEIQKKPE